MGWNTLSRKLSWFNRPQRIPSTAEAIDLHAMESRRIIRKYNDRNLFEEGNVRQFTVGTERNGSIKGDGNDMGNTNGKVLTRIRPGHFVTILKPSPPTGAKVGEAFTQFTAVEHNNGYITRIFDNVIYGLDDVDEAALNTAESRQGTAGMESDVFTPVYVAQEPQEFAGGRTIMHEYYPGERLIFMIPRRGVWLQVRVHNDYEAALEEGDFVKVTTIGTVMKATVNEADDRSRIVGVVRQGIMAAGTGGFREEADKLAPITPKYDARLVTIEIV